MNRVILQVPVTRDLRDAAENTALDFGFSSLQEALRVFMTKMANKQVTLSFEDKTEYLTDVQEKVLAKKYNKFLADKKNGKTFVAHSTEGMFSQLTS
jgi:hypothetical protein